ncbi:hypothetical protein D3C72_2171170 [compost metagenome]
MKVKKPFTDKVADILRSQLFGAQDRDPFGVAAADQVLDRIRGLQVRSLQAQQAYVAGMLKGRRQGTAMHIPAHTAQAWQQAMTVIARIDDQQAAVGCRL